MMLEIPVVDPPSIATTPLALMSLVNASRGRDLYRRMHCSLCEQAGNLLPIRAAIAVASPAAAGVASTRIRVSPSCRLPPEPSKRSRPEDHSGREAVVNKCQGTRVHYSVVAGRDVAVDAPETFRAASKRVVRTMNQSPARMQTFLKN